MKRFIYPFFFLLVAMGCTSEYDGILPTPALAQPGTLVPAQAVGQWKLVKMIHRTQIAGQPDGAYPLPYEEILHLQPDSSVIRYRNGVKATGSFSIETYPNTTEWHVLIKFDDPTVAFHTFGNYNWGFGQGMGLWNGEAEYLLLDYSPSDGPTAYYQKVPATK